MSSTVINLKKAPVAKRSRMDTVAISQRTLKIWLMPPFQRPLRVNEKVRQIAEEIRDNGGVVPGVLTLGVLTGGKDAGTYILDGQHRIHALEMSGVEEAYADVRIVDFDDMAEMGKEFVELNSAIVRMSPDDVLRGIEGSLPTLSVIRKHCPFVGYGNLRRGNYSPILSMSMCVRLWAGTTGETPLSGSQSALHLAQQLTTEDAEQLSQFLNLAFTAWGREPANNRLWGALNLGMCMWMWRRLVLDTDRSGNKRATVLKATQFSKCLNALTSEVYTDWLVGRILGDRDRSPTYNRIKQLFTARLKADGSDLNPKFPQPAWAANAGGKG